MTFWDFASNNPGTTFLIVLVIAMFIESIVETIVKGREK